MNKTVPTCGGRQTLLYDVMRGLAGAFEGTMIRYQLDELAGDRRVSVRIWLPFWALPVLLVLPRPWLAERARDLALDVIDRYVPDDIPCEVRWGKP